MGQMTNRSFSLPSSIALRTKYRLKWLQPKSKLTEPNKPIPTKPELFILLCSIFPEDFSKPIEDLILYGKGLNLFEDVHDMMGAIDQVCHDHIKITRDDSRYSIDLRLEEDEYGNQYVKMPIGAHTIASSIASRHHLVFGYETLMNKWPRVNKYIHCKGLALVLKSIRKHPLTLKHPKLELLQLQYRGGSQCLPVSFFDGMENLRVLSLDAPSAPPYSLNSLRNLGTLRLKVKKLENMAWIGGLINLESLIISVVSSTDIPQEIGDLNKLKLLDLRKMHIAYVPYGIFSRMLKLEELYLPLSFKRWGCKIREERDSYEKWGSSEENGSNDEENAILSETDEVERIKASLIEILSLSLNALQICFPNLSLLPRNSSIFTNIFHFKILFPNNLKCQSFGNGPTNELQLTGDACRIKGSGICALNRRTEGLSLIKIKNLKNVMCQLEDYEFPRLKKMIVTECNELEYLVDTRGNWVRATSFWELESLHLSMLPNMKEIWHGKRPIFLVLDNLREINIRFCRKLKYVFPLSMAKELKQLQSIEILGCDEMEGIFCKNKANDKANVHPADWSFIRNLHLHSLPKLTSFLVQKDTAGDQLISEDIGTSQSFSTDESCFLSTSSSMPKQQFVSNKQVSLISEGLMKQMEVYCEFSSGLTNKRFEGLEKLKIAFCDALEVIFSFDRNHANSKVFSSLKELELYGLRNLVHIWFLVPQNITGFQNLQLLVVSECDNKYLFSPQVAKLLVRLEKMQISRCEKMEEIVVNEEMEGIMDEIAFPKLKALELQYMPNLRIFYGGICTINLSLLESMRLNQCCKMESFSYKSPKTERLDRVQIDERSYPLLLYVYNLNALIKWRRRKAEWKW